MHNVKTAIQCCTAVLFAIQCCVICRLPYNVLPGTTYVLPRLVRSYLAFLRVWVEPLEPIQIVGATVLLAADNIDIHSANSRWGVTTAQSFCGDRPDKIACVCKKYLGLPLFICINASRGLIGVMEKLSKSNWQNHFCHWLNSTSSTNPSCCIFFSRYYARQ